MFSLLFDYFPNMIPFFICLYVRRLLLLKYTIYELSKSLNLLVRFSKLKKSRLKEWADIFLIMF